MKHHFGLVLVVAIAVLYNIGCSSGPSVSEGRAIVEKQIRDQSKGIISLIDFKKTNGQEGEVFGVKTYVMEFQATISFRSDCYWGSGGFETAFGEPTATNFAMYMGKTKATSGQKVVVAGLINFSKTENGWEGQITSMHVAKTTAASTDETKQGIEVKDEAIINDLNNLAARAYQYRIRPKQMNGGGGSYEGFAIPPGLSSDLQIVRESPNEIVLRKKGVNAIVDSQCKVRFENAQPSSNPVIEEGTNEKPVAPKSIDKSVTDDKEKLRQDTTDIAQVTDLPKLQAEYDSKYESFEKRKSLMTPEFRQQKENELKELENRISELKKLDSSKASKTTVTTMPSPRQAFDDTLNTFPDNSYFSQDFRILQYSFDSVWNAVIVTLGDNDEKITSADKATGIIVTALTQHQKFMDMDNRSRVVVFLQRLGDNKTSMSLKGFRYEQTLNNGKEIWLCNRSSSWYSNRIADRIKKKLE